MSNATQAVVTQQVVVTEVAQNLLEVLVPSQPNVIEVVTAGPQGPGSTISNLSDLSDVEASQTINGSVLCYNEMLGKWKGDDINTVVTLTDGGNF